MNILIVYTHPSKKSYTFHMFEQLTYALTKQNWEVSISDLYAMDFESDMTEQEYEREGFARTELQLSNDILDEHKKSRKCWLHYFSLSSLVE